MLQTTPYTRTSEWTKDDQGKLGLRFYSPSNPHYFYDLERDQYLPINAGAVEQVEKATVNRAFLRNRNQVSMGWRKDGDRFKFIGLRPDECQLEGTEQLEFSLIGIEVDGHAVPIDLSKNDYIDPFTVSLGSVVVRSTRHFTKQLVPIKKKTDSVRMVYQLHLKGLQLLDEYPNYRVVNAEGKTRFTFLLPKVFDKDFNLIPGAQVTHSIQDVGGSVFYVKEIQGLKDFEPPYYVDADTFYGATTDGCTVYEYYGVVSWPTAVAAAAQTVESALTTGVATLIAYQTPSWHAAITRSHLLFDTSALPDELDISAASVHIYSHQVVGSFNFALQKSNFATPLALAAHTSFTGSTLSSPAAAYGWNTLSLSSGEGFSSIITSGYSKYCLRCYDYDVYYRESFPVYLPAAGAELYSQIRFADYSGTSTDPYLSVTYTLPRLRGRVILVM